MVSSVKALASSMEWTMSTHFNVLESIGMVVNRAMTELMIMAKKGRYPAQDQCR